MCTIEGLCVHGGLQELQPQLEALEAQWFHLHTLTAANTPEEVVAFWEGLHPCYALFTQHAVLHNVQ